MRVIRVMADYQCFPLWEASPGVVGNIDPCDLPISISLQRDLIGWAETFDATLNIDDPASSGLKTESDIDEFRRRGEALVLQLQEELGGAYLVTKKL